MEYWFNIPYVVIQFSSSLPSKQSVTLLHLPSNDITSIFVHTKYIDDFHMGGRSWAVVISTVVMLFNSIKENTNLNDDYFIVKFFT